MSHCTLPPCDTETEAKIRMFSNDAALFLREDCIAHVNTKKRFFPVFKLDVFLLELFWHVMFPISVPIMWLVYGRAALHNHFFVPNSGAVVFYSYTLPVLTIAANAVFAVWVTTYPEVVSSNTHETCKSCLFLADIIYFSRCAVVASKHAFSEHAWVRLLRSHVVPARLVVSRHMTSWLNPSLDVLEHEIDIASASVDLPSVGMQHTFTFNPADRRAQIALTKLLIPDVVRDKLRCRRPELRVEPGRVPARLVVLSTFVRATAMGSFPVLRLACVDGVGRGGGCAAFDPPPALPPDAPPAASRPRCSRLPLASAATCRSAT